MTTPDERRQEAERRLGNRSPSATRFFTSNYGTRSTGETSSTLSIRFPDSLLARVAEYGNAHVPPLNASEAVRELVTGALSIESLMSQPNESDSP